MIRDAQRVLVVSHQDPDGDALGSSLGIMHLLRDAGRKVFVHSAGPGSRGIRFYARDG